MFRTSILLSAVVVLGCTPQAAPFTGSKGSPMGSPTTASVGMSGGRVVAGALTITVPAGALPDGTMITATPISSTVPGKRGQAIRLEPEGTTFSQPVTLTFRYSDEDLEGTAPEALLIAYQHSSGKWAVPGDVTLDTSARTISVQTTHFSDWSMVAGAQLRPPSKSLKVNQSVTLVARRCFAPPESTVEMELAPLLIGYSCDADEELAPLPVATSDWSVNGVPGGSGSTGTVVGELSQGTFTAPSTKPSPNSVAVSARVELTKKGKVLVNSNVTITDDSATLNVRARYSKTGQGLTAFVSGDVTDEGFQFEMPFPLIDGDYSPLNLSGGRAANLTDSRANCLTPTMSGDWDELNASKATLAANYLTIEGSRSVPAITFGRGEGDCSVDRTTDPARTEMNGFMVSLPIELLTSSTPPAAPLTATAGSWTLTITTK
jgi:hypothetical protein